MQERPFFESMNASVEIIPAMIMEDVQTGLEEALKAFVTKMGITIPCVRGGS